jgi:magnesium-transporting ATPase (P-type)
VVTIDCVLVKGAPDAIIERCVGAPRDVFDEVLHDMSDRGLRVLAVAERSWTGAPPAAADDAESDLTLLGLLGFQDPPRAEARDALAACRLAGISVGMITGDHPQTARAIADDVGLRRPGDPVLVGADLPEDDQVLAALIDRDGIVIARVSPEQKLRIAKALRSRGHVIAMTGDGVNDGPALREADIGIAMGKSGSDVAREAADLVLLDDNFATIVAAVRQGRATFANARRFLTYHLTDNVAELTPFAIWALSGGQFPLALGVLQILALDIGTDTLSAAALGAEPADANVMTQAPSSGRLLDRTVAIRSFGVLGPTEAVFEMAAFVVALWLAGWRIGDTFPTGAPLYAASGAAFLTVVVAQSANAFACRSARRPTWRVAWFANRFLLAAVLLELAFAVAVIAVPAAADLLDHSWPPAGAWVLVLLSAPAVLVVDALWKRSIRGRR